MSSVKSQIEVRNPRKERTAQYTASYKGVIKINAYISESVEIFLGVVMDIPSNSGEEGHSSILDSCANSEGSSECRRLNYKRN
jgi:hypothetical protein